MKGGTTGPYVNSTRHSGQWRGGPANIKGANRSLRCGLLSSLGSTPPTPHPPPHTSTKPLSFFIHLFIYLSSEEKGKKKQSGSFQPNYPGGCTGGTEWDFFFL